MKIVFLDFDGVMNSEQWFWRGGAPGGEQFDPESVVALNEITVRTGARIVVSSSWRHFHDDAALREILGRNGVSGLMIGSTPRLGRNEVGPPDCDFGERPAERGDEIEAWLDEHPEVSSFVILDDDSDMRGLLPRLVQTEWKVGLTLADARRAIELLGA